MVGVSRSQVARWYREEAMPSDRYRRKLFALADFWRVHNEGLDELRESLRM